MVLFLASLLSLPLWATALAIWDVVSGDTRLPRLRCCLFLFHYLFSQFWGIIASAVLWLRYRKSSDSEFQRVHYRLQGVWASSIFWGAKAIFQVKVEIEGQELAQNAPFLLLVRHTSLADTVLAATFIAHPNQIGLRYVLKKELLWDPCLDIVGRRLPNHFVDRSGKRREEELESIKRLARELASGEGILIYPEGTRFSPKKKERALKRLNEAGQEALAERAQAWDFVLPPRPGGVLSLLEELPDTDVLVLSHTGFEGTARWKDFWSGCLIRKTLRLKLARIPAITIPTDERVDWLYSNWDEVNAWVEENHEP